MTKYNPEQHKSTVEYHRNAFEKKRGQSLSDLTDIEIWDTVELIPDPKTARHLLQRVFYSKKGIDLPLDDEEVEDESEE